MSAQKTATTNTVTRPPVICILGHIDHGKSTLLDHIRQAHVAEKEAGGITQAISAYGFEHKGSDGKTRTLTFLDTPGHEAFQKMRLRGAIVADIAVLVVSAEDGVKKQTTEAYEAIKEAGAPFIVAITKIDKPNANVERVKNTLAEAGIYLEGYGGDISYVPVSAKTGEGIPELLDLIALTADIGDFKGDLAKPAEGYVIETTRDAKRGIYATLIIKDGALETGSFVVSGSSWAPVRALDDFLGKKMKSSGPGTAVGLSGWSSVPPVGEMFMVVKTKREAEDMAAEAAQKATAPKKAANAAEDKDKKTIVLAIKADTLGSTEAIAHELKKVYHERVILKTVHTGIGDISESDVKNVSGKDQALILGFNVKIDAQAKAIAERLGVMIEISDIIYKLAEWLDKFVKENAPKIEVEEIVGEAKIMKFFSKVKDRQIVGGKVLKGSIGVGHKVKIKRRDADIGTGVIKELQKQKERAQSVDEGFEFGAMIEAKMEIAPGDIISDFVIVEKQ